jgi:hypothetical protein
LALRGTRSVGVRRLVVGRRRTDVGVVHLAGRLGGQIIGDQTKYLLMY